MANILIKGNTAAEQVIDPYRLQDRIPGFADSMDGIKDLRDNYVEVDAGMGHLLSLPPAAWLALNLSFPNQKELTEHIYPRVWQKYPEYRVSRKAWK